MERVFILIVTMTVLVGGLAAVAFVVYRRTLREAKNYERGLKMVPLLIHLPPATEDIDASSRDKRDVIEEALSQASVMYNIIASTATKGFKSKIYGQRHISFEIVAHDGLVRYYAVVPTVLVESVKQAVAAAYPSSRLEEVAEHNLFSEKGKMTGTIGGEFTLKKNFTRPIATYTESRRDASRSLLNALSAAAKEDGVGIQLLIRPAPEGWTTASRQAVEKIKKDRATGKTAGGVFYSVKDLGEALWKPPQSKDDAVKPEHTVDTQLTALEQKEIEAIEEKTRYPGFETLIRVVVSSNTAAKSQTLMKNVVSAFALFDSQSNNGFRFSLAKNMDEFTSSYILRFFPQSITSNILNSVELASIFHLPDKESIPTSQVQRQMSKQVDGPTQIMDEGLLLGYNEFRGVKKPIRLSDKDRRRHIHVIGQTGTGKSVLLENLAFQDMMDGRGFAFVDPHGDSVEALLSKVPKERVEDVIYFNPSDMDHPIGLNMFEFDHPDQKDFLVQEAISMLYGLYDPGHTGIVGPRLEHIFRNCALLLMSDPAGGTFIDIPKLLVDESFMKSKLKYVTDQQVLDFWTKEFPASQRSSEAGEVISWVVSKFGPFISNDAMRNIIGQTKSGFNIADVMNNRKILLVNLSKGKMGDLNSKLLGIIFVMKFQAAAMARANLPEEQREDFTLYVDEFQNFATDSFETILSEARKYRLSLAMGNQFMTQLKEELREAIIGNVGTTITGRIGITDAEIMVKRYTPVFDAEDLTKLPNYESVCVAQIQGVPSAPFSMSWIPPMGQANQQLSDALKRLSSAKYGKPRAQVEQDIFKRLTVVKPAQPSAGGLSAKAGSSAGKPASSGSSFLDEWLAKRKQLSGATNSGVKNASQSPPPVQAPPSPAPMQSAVQPPAVPPVAQQGMSMAAPPQQLPPAPPAMLEGGQNMTENATLAPSSSPAQSTVGDTGAYELPPQQPPAPMSVAPPDNDSDIPSQAAQPPADERLQLRGVGNNPPNDEISIRLR